MKIRWPPPPLGLGTPLNLAGRRFRWRTCFLAVFLGAVTPPLILGLDRLLFAGSSMARVRMVAAQPLLRRIVIVLYSGPAEELIFRVVAATLVAWLAYLALRKPTAAMWIGIVAGAVLFGLAHVANLPNVPHPYLRAITLNGIAGMVFGWLYWWKGLEAAVLAHFTADAVLYLLVPALLILPS